MCPWASEHVREGAGLNSLSLWDVVVPSIDVGQVLGAAHAMVPIFESDDRIVFCVNPCKLGCHGICFRATRSKIDTVKTFWEFGSQLFGVKTMLIVQINSGRVL